MAKSILTVAVLTCSLSAQAVRALDQFVVESAREIPLAYDVDVVVVGGATRGVAAAVAAAEAGAKVFLAAPHPYLGEDMCATHRLWLEEGEAPTSELGEAIFAPASSKVLIGGLPFTYEANVPSAAHHRDTQKPSLLTDGALHSASFDSVQFDGPVTIIADLGNAVDLTDVILLAYQRNDDFEVGNVVVSTSTDKTQWSEAATVANTKIGKASSEDDPVELTASVKATARYVRLVVTPNAECKRILLAELVIKGKAAAVAESTAKLVAAKRVTKPMQVKVALDRALLDAKVDFLYGSYATDILRDQNGRLAGIVMANRSGRQAVRAKVIIDATDRGIAARLTEAKFAAYPSGKQTFKRIVVGGSPGEVVVPWHGGILGSNFGVPNMAFIKSGTVSECGE